MIKHLGIFRNKQYISISFLSRNNINNSKNIIVTKKIIT